MALPRVTPGTYNYGAYSNPTPIKYKGGLGEGLVGTAAAAARVIKAKKEQKEKEEKEEEQNQFTAFDSSHVYKQGLMKSLPNANEDNTQIINELTQKRYETVLAYKNREISFDEYRMRYDKEENIKNKLFNFKDYVLDKAEGEEADFASIRQTEGDINKWGRDKAFSYGAQGFKLDINYEKGTVGFIHPALDWDKFKDEEGTIDFSKIEDIENTDNWRTVSTDIDELFSDKNAFAPTLKYTYTQDAQFFNDSVQKLTPEAGRYAKGIDNGYAIFNPGDKEKFKQEIVLPQINDNVIQMRGMQIYEDILGAGIFDKNNPAHIQAVKNEMANKILSLMPTSFGKVSTKGSSSGSQNNITNTKYYSDFNKISDYLLSIQKSGQKEARAKRDAIMNNPNLTQEQKTAQTYPLLSKMMTDKKITLEDQAEALRLIGVQAYTKDNVIARFDPETEEGKAGINQINQTKASMYVQQEGGKFKPLISIRNTGNRLEGLIRAYGETLPDGQLTQFNKTFGNIFGVGGTYQSASGNTYNLN
tara:strand:+ start:2662 stop:4254 length:1593 start_codon:yes stop_codon:yes gene_type:complete